jgi:glycosyltransferase involved in cell wall biosynthesis
MKIPFLGLLMIVKNESHIIREVLKSVIKYIDTFVISDTGSTDNTVEVISDFFKQYNISGHIIHHDWADFGTNRTLLLEYSYDLFFLASYCTI